MGIWQVSEQDANRGFDRSGRAVVKLGNALVGSRDCYHHCCHLSLHNLWPLSVFNMSELLIKVAITYKGDKARSVVPGNTSQADVVTTLRTDLTRLKSLHPKTETIQLHSAGHITC